MKFSDDVVRVALEYRHKRYAEGQRVWSDSYHVDCWEMAAVAFEQGSFSDFQKIYSELSRQWQVFRGGGAHWDVEQVWDVLQAVDLDLTSMRLSELTQDRVHSCWAAIKRLSPLKTNKSGPSVMAISKFLHFRNPRLFVIVDRAVMWDRVLTHQWLWRPIELQRQQLAQELDLPCGKRGEACDLMSYMAVLVWGGQMLRQNPHVGQLFAAGVGNHCPGRVTRLPLATYEAAALEWLLMGLVELPPDLSCDYANG